MKNFMIKYSRLRFLTLLAFGVAVCAIAIAGCVETKDEFTVNPDGSGKIVHELTFASMDLGPGFEMGSEEASFDITGGEPSDPQAQLRKSVKEILSQSSGVDTWKDVSYKMTDDGRTYFKGTAYFPDINNLSLHNAGFSGDMKLNFTRDISGEITIELKSEEQAEEGKAVEIPTPEIPEAQLDNLVKQAKLNYNQTRPMMQGILPGLKSETILHLPADIKEISNFEKVNARTVRIAFEGSKMIEVMDKMMQDEAWLKEQIRAGKDPIQDGPEGDLAMNEMFFGEKAPVRVVLAQGAQQLFDYDAEVTAARANYENMLKELGLEGAEPTRPTRAEKAAAETVKEDTEKAAAETIKEDPGQREVLTTLEQRMQERITINASDLPIDMVIRQLAEQADVDLIKSPEVIGNVTATLTDVPLEEALKNILRAHGFDYVTDKNMIRIVPVGDIIEAEERLTSKIYRITYADVAEVEKALGKFISKRGTVSLNKGTSHIIVTDTESNIKAIDKFVEEIDQITPQVLVEVRIYDITSQDTLDLGVEWQAGRNTTYGTTGGIATVGTNPTNRTDPFMTGLFSNSTSKTGSSSSGVLRFGFLNSSIDIDAALKAQQETVNAKLLANPRILVLDNEKALFDIVREIPYTEVSTTGNTATETVKFKPVGVKLEVTPHITRDGMLRLHIKPEFGVHVGGTDPPAVDTRKVDTTALVKDGQTVVLGGLRKKDVTQQTNKIPLLGDLPLLGALFRFQGEDTTNSEIVVFITPRIITQPVLSEDEQQAYKATEFSRPEPVITKAEAEASKK